MPRWIRAYLKRSSVIELGKAPRGADSDEEDDPGSFSEKTDCCGDDENADRRNVSNALTV